MNMKSLFTSVHKINLISLVQQRSVVFALYGVFFLLCMMFLFSLVGRFERAEEKKRDLEHLQLRLQKIRCLHKDQMDFIRKYQNADTYYVSNVLEKLDFLKPEVDALKLVNAHPAFETCENVRKRLEVVSGDKNRLKFSEGVMRKGESLQEVDLRQMAPVEVNTGDLKHLLLAIESEETGETNPPQFIVRRLSLKKKKLAERETYQLDMQLIQRGLVK